MTSLTKKQKIIIISVAVAVAVIIAIIVPVVVVCTRNNKVTDKYTVRFDTRGGSEIASYVLDEGAAIGRPAENPTYEDNMFLFSGWYTDMTYETPFPFGSAMPSHDVTVYAYWLSNESNIEVTYNANGGTFDNDVTEIIGLGKVGDAFVAAATPTRTGYLFDRWYVDSDCVFPFSADVFPDESIKIYAGWAKDQENYAYVSFYGNGVLLDTVPVEKGGDLPQFEFLPEIYQGDIICDKWYTNSAMTVENTVQTVSFDIDLYTTFYTDGLVISNGTVMNYTGTASKVYVPSKFEGQSVLTIGANAFYRSDEFGSLYGRVKEVVLPETIMTVSNNAFYDCRYLEKINLSGFVRTIGDNAFWNNERLKELGDISSVTVIGNGAFTGCSVLRNIVLPNTLTTLGANVFADCAELREIVIPANVTVIGDYAFDGCKLLTKVEIIGSAFSDIGRNAFRNCESLEQVIIRADRLVEFGMVEGKNSMYSPFMGCDNVQISVQESLLDSYKSAYGEWDDGALNNKFIVLR